MYPKYPKRRSGFARFTNTRFSMKKEDITNTYIHLTNVAIQKHAPGFDKSKGMKWAIRSLRTFLTTKHGPEATNECFNNIQARSAASALRPLTACACWLAAGYPTRSDQRAGLIVRPHNYEQRYATAQLAPNPTPAGISCFNAATPTPQFGQPNATRRTA